jgi:serine/threonine protein kinase
MIPKNESSDFISQFNFEEKNYYNWSIIGFKKQIDSEIIKSGLCEGSSKSNKNNFIYVKQYFIDSENQNELKNILKEVFLFKTFQNQNYFPPNIKYSLSKDEKNLFISFKGNYVSLNALIESNYNYEEQNGLIQWIIYQIVYTLYLLHSSGITLLNVNPSNIFINQYGKIFISDLSCAIFGNEQYYSYSLPYSSPEFLIDNSKINQKVDMWSLGILIIELYCKQVRILKPKRTKNSEEEQLKQILSLFEINEQYSENDLKNILLSGNDKFEWKLNQNILNKIKDINAINLISQLLNINPNSRPTARQVIESNYLKEYKGVDNLDIKDFEKLEEYKKYLQSTIINHEIFVNEIKKINRKESEITSNSNILIFSNNNNIINEQEKNEILI